MKRIKKLASLLLALVMVFAMSATAFAAEQNENLQPPSGEEGGNNDNPSTDGNQDDATASQPTISSGTYNIYQVFTGDYSEGILSNVKWGQNGTGTVGEKVDIAILEELEAVYKDADNADNNFEIDDVAQLEVIKKYANLENPIQTGTATSYTGLKAGYYLVGGTVTYSNGQTAETLYVVRVIDGTLTFMPKVGVPTVDKKIVEGEDRVETNEASIGDEVNYEITGTMPSNIANYNTYYYVFTDTLSKGLTFDKNSVVVTVDGVDVTKYFYVGEEINPETGSNTITIGIQDLLTLKHLNERIAIQFTENTKVVVTYKAILNEDAVIAGNGNPNDVKLDYSNDPNHSGDGSTTPPETPEKPDPEHPTGETPKSEVVTYTTELTILKTDENNKFLPGVEFTLTGNGVNIVLVTEEKFEAAADGEYWKLKDGTYTTTAPTVADDETDNTADYDSVDTKYTKTTSVVAKGNGKTETDVVGTVQADGTVTFKGLGAGEYTITETKTLPGYNTIDPITFTLTFDAETKIFASNNDKVTVGTDNMLDTSIVNQKGSLLPSTGGIGTTIFYVVGGILVIGAGILLVTKKRMSAR